MMRDKAVRMDIEVAMVGVLAVFAVALAIPMANALLTIQNSISTGSALSSPGLPMTELFLLLVEASLVWSVLSMARVIIRRDRRWGRENEGTDERFPTTR